MISYVGRSIANVCILVRASAAEILKTMAQVYVVAHIKSALVSGSSSEMHTIIPFQQSGSRVVICAVSPFGSNAFIL